MTTCPYCKHEICIRELRHPGLFENYRICLYCGGRFTIDRKTKRKQAIFIVIALISLAFTLLLYFQGETWLPPALVSYVVPGLLVYRANKKVFFVPYPD